MLPTMKYEQEYVI